MSVRQRLNSLIDRESAGHLMRREASSAEGRRGALPLPARLDGGNSNIVIGYSSRIMTAIGTGRGVDKGQGNTQPQNPNCLGKILGETNAFEGNGDMRRGKFRFWVKCRVRAGDPRSRAREGCDAPSPPRPSSQGDGSRSGQH